MSTITRDLVDGREASAPAQSDLPEAPALTEFSRHARQLTCLYGVVDALRDNASVEEAVCKLADLIPLGWQYPEIARASVALDHIMYPSSVTKSPWSMSSDIIVNGQTRGAVEVRYTELRPDAHEGPFLEEERELLNRIAHLLAETIERRAIESELLVERAAIESSIDGIIACRGNEIVLANKSAAHMFGHQSIADLVGRLVTALMPEQARNRGLQVLAGPKGDEPSELIPKTFETEGIRTDGTMFPIEVSLSHLSGNAHADVVATMRDISGQRLDGEELRLRSAALAAAGDMVMIIDLEDRIQYVNEAFTRETGYTSDEAIGQRPGTLLRSARQDSDFDKRLWSTIMSGSIWQGESVNRRKNGTLYTEEMTVTPLFDDGGEIANFVAIKRDITERRRLEEELIKLATTDSLTGLTSRHQFNVLLGQAVDRARRSGGHGALAILDLDGFKYVNDAYGHVAGDALIVRIADELGNSVRDSDLVARIGGDDFAVIMPDTAIEDAFEIVSGLAERIASVSLEHDGERVSVACSAGIAGFPKRHADVEDIVACADIALQHSKRGGKGRVVLCRDLEEGRETISALQRSRTMILDAIADHRIRLHWQPIVSTTDGTTYMHEVLARLEDSGGNLRSPAEFIPQAETLNIIGELDRRVVSLAFRNGAAIAETGSFPRLSINLSAHCINDEMAAFLIEESKRVGFPLESTVIEVTETAVLNAGTAVQGAMQRLVGQGVSFAMDDFGSGAASLRNLKTLPFTYMKLDGDCVRGMHLDDRKRDFASCLAQLAATLGLQVIAEHVECEETLQLLHEANIEFAQGYFTGRPVPMPRGPQ